MTDPVHDLVISHRRFAAAYALKLARGALMTAHADDAVSEAMVGLVEAAQRFDPDRGMRFVNYLRFHLLNRVGRFLAANRGAVRMPRSEVLSETSIRMAKVAGGLRAKLGRDPSPDDFAAALGVPVERVEEAIMLRSARPTPVSTTGDFEEGCYAAPSADPNPEDRLAGAESDAAARDVVNRALSLFTERDADILRSRRCADEPETLASIASRRGMVSTYVSRVEMRLAPKFERALRREADKLGWRP